MYLCMLIISLLFLNLMINLTIPMKYTRLFIYIGGQPITMYTYDTPCVLVNTPYIKKQGTASHTLQQQLSE